MRSGTEAPGQHSGLNGSEVSTVLATQENSYEYERVMTGLEEQWPKHRLFRRDRDTEKSHAHSMAGLVNLSATTKSWANGSIQRRIKLTNQRGHLEHRLGRVVLGRHGTLELRTRVLSCLTSGSVARNSGWQCGWFVCVRVRRWRYARSPVGYEQRCTHIHGGPGSVDLGARCQRILAGRGSCSCSGNRKWWQKRAEMCQKTGKSRKRQGQEHEWKERKNVIRQGQVKKTTTLLHL